MDLTVAFAGRTAAANSLKQQDSHLLPVELSRQDLVLDVVQRHRKLPFSSYEWVGWKFTWLNYSKGKSFLHGLPLVSFEMEKRAPASAASTWQRESSVTDGVKRFLESLPPRAMIEKEFLVFLRDSICFEWTQMWWVVCFLRSLVCLLHFLARGRQATTSW